jgi:hypothetical protein
LLDLDYVQTPVLMQVAAEVISPEIAVLKVVAATAMAEPTMARIKAYSAAEAPLSSDTNVFTNFNIINSPLFNQ